MTAKKFKRFNFIEAAKYNQFDGISNRHVDEQNKNQNECGWQHHTLMTFLVLQI